MNTSDKQIIEKIVKSVLENKKIPSEDKIRQIAREELERYYTKQENELKKSFSQRFNDYFHDKKYKNIFWYIIMWILTGLDVIGFKILVESSKQIIANSSNLNIIRALIFVALTIVVMSFIILVSMKVFDKIIEMDYKNARIICLLEILYWCNVLIPNASSFIENIL